jgi:hypothetical protein
VPTLLGVGGDRFAAGIGSRPLGLDRLPFRRVQVFLALLLELVRVRRQHLLDEASVQLGVVLVVSGTDRHGFLPL